MDEKSTHEDGRISNSKEDKAPFQKDFAIIEKEYADAGYTLPGGFISGDNSLEHCDNGIGKQGFWWTSSNPDTPTGIYSAGYIGMSYYSGEATLSFYDVRSKMSVRCVKDR